MPDFGDGSTRENYGELDTLAPSVANGQITPAQWAEYQRQMRNKRIWGILGTIGATTGLGALGGALSGGGGAAAAGSVGGATLPAAATEGMLPMSVAGAAGGTGAGVGAGAGAAGAAGRTIMGMQPRDLAALGLSLGSTVGGLTQGRPNIDPNTQTTDPNLQKLIATMQGRLDQSEPLYKSIMAMANGLLPTQYQNGGSGR